MNENPNQNSNPSSPDDLRAQGWMVACHNDYRQGGRLYTFWLLSKGDRCLRGEGRTDAIALDYSRRILSREAQEHQRTHQAYEERVKRIRERVGELVSEVNQNIRASEPPTSPVPPPRLCSICSKNVSSWSCQVGVPYGDDGDIGTCNVRTCPTCKCPEHDRSGGCGQGIPRTEQEARHEAFLQGKMTREEAFGSGQTPKV